MYLRQANQADERSGLCVFLKQEVRVVADAAAEIVADGAYAVQPGDEGTVLAVLANLRDRKSAVAEIVRRIAGLDAVKRDAALGQLIVLSGLRGLEKTVEEEIRKMPILNDIMDHKVLGREYKRGLAEGIEEGRQDGIQQGELRILRRLLEKRFGPIPAWVEERIGDRSAEDLEALGVRLLEAESLAELLA